MNEREPDKSTILPSRRLTRRETLRVLAGSAGAVLPILDSRPAWSAAHHAHHAAPLDAQGVPAAPQFFMKEQMAALDALTETIIPTDAHSPGAVAAGVSRYIDSLVSEADEGQKKLWLQGLAAVDRLAQEQWGKIYAQAAPDQQVSLLTKLSENEETPKTPEEHFFVALKQATIDGYYTSEIGIHKDLEYQGNEVLAEFEGCTHPGHHSQPPPDGKAAS